MLSPPLSGSEAEALALCFLTEQGLQLLCKNFSCKLGEIDIIMRDSNSLVFVEVRYRKSNRFGTPLESVNVNKQRKLRATAQYFIKGQANHSIAARFDVLGISSEASQTQTIYQGYQLDWCQNAF